MPKGTTAQSRKDKLMKLNELKKGDYFRVVRSGKLSRSVYIKGGYDRGEKKFLCTDFYDAGSEGKYFKATQEVTTEFEF